ERFTVMRVDVVAVSNADDSRVAACADVSSGVEVLTYVTTATAQVRAENVRTDAAGLLSFTLLTSSGSAEIATGLVGVHHVTNVLAAAAAALALGQDLDQVSAAAAGARALSPHRMQVTETGGITV